MGLLALPFVLLRLYWRGRYLPEYRKRWLERLGFFNKPQLSQPIWIHAVSFGEAAAAQELIKSLLKAYPKRSIVVTTTTPTGSAKITQTFGKKVFHVYMPYDVPFCVKRFLAKIQPDLLIIMETELWPNTLHYCAKQEIAVLLANARLSDESARGYQRIIPLARKMTSHLTMIAAQAEHDAANFRRLGAADKQLMIMGSVKFDITPPAELLQRGKALRQSWQDDRLVWTAASTHHNEEEQLLDVFIAVRQTMPNLLLILVPRHPERFDEVFQLCRKKGLNVVRRSQDRSCSHDTNVLLGDSMGEMFMYYAAADVALVGGSLVPVGGHNVLEPAAIGLPVMSGKHLRNFLHISQLLEEAGALLVINDCNELQHQLLRLLQDKTLRQQAGNAGYEVVRHNRGALAKHLTWIHQYLQGSTN